MNTEKRHFLRSLIFPSFLLIVMWAVKLIEYNWNLNFANLGILPLKAVGLIGIITSPFIHENFQHLISNSIPLFLLTLTLFYFYKGISGRVFFLIYLIVGICVWLSAREAYHLGASGIVYGLASFLFFSGIIRRDSRLAAITLVIAFLYGSMVWGIFPDFFPGKNISFESHLWGLISGILFAIFYRKQGPQRKQYTWETEEELPENNDGITGDVFWSAPNNFDDFMFKL
ncbi:MAG: rhomboid family intramembrane serine protease [Bacteroidetes bacterium]|nr:rhomboid family intramembrane serine protease [Bacteroidota bacterium]